MAWQMKLTSQWHKGRYQMYQPWLPEVKEKKSIVVEIFLICSITEN